MGKFCLWRYWYFKTIEKIGRRFSLDFLDDVILTDKSSCQQLNKYYTCCLLSWERDLWRSYGSCRYGAALFPSKQRILSSPLDISLFSPRQWVRYDNKINNLGSRIKMGCALESWLLRVATFDFLRSTTETSLCPYYGNSYCMF